MFFITQITNKIDCVVVVMETHIKFISKILECPCNKIHIVVTVYNVVAGME